VNETRDFLFRSLDDLEAEHAAGNIDDETYARLHADYTARAAIAVRHPDEDDVPGAPRTSGRHRFFVVGGLVVFAVVVATVLALTVGARLPGNTATGRSVAANQPTAKERERALEAVAKRRPHDVNAQLALARFRLGRRDFAGALTAFRAAATIEPNNAEPYAYSGWIVRLQGYPDQAMQLLDKAVSVDPGYPDAHFFRGFVLLRDQHDPKSAIPEFQQYLVAAPDSPLADQVRTLLAEAVESAKPSPSP
jgi:cytochrome c-type biogenesis protein CcmH/NrfG